MVGVWDRLEPIDRDTTAGVIAAQIRARIMDGAFPPGFQLGEAQLASRLEVSRGPVREALQRLIQEGLLVSKRNRGVCVISFSEEDVVDIYRARGAIEREAAKILIQRRDQSAFDGLEELVDLMSDAAKRGEWPELAKFDLRFHEALVGFCGSKRLRRMFGTLLVEARMCLSELESAYPVQEHLVREHRGLLDAMRRGEEQKALDLIDAHLRDAVKDLTTDREQR